MNLLKCLSKGVRLGWETGGIPFVPGSIFSSWLSLGAQGPTWAGDFPHTLPISVGQIFVS